MARVTIETDTGEIATVDEAALHLAEGIPGIARLDGFDDPEIDLWPRHNGRRVAEAALSFTGKLPLEGDRADVREMAPIVRENAYLRLLVGGSIVSAKYAAEGQLEPFSVTYALRVEDVAFDPGDGELAQRIQDALEAIEETRAAWGATIATEVDRQLGLITAILNGEAPDA